MRCFMNSRFLLFINHLSSYFYRLHHYRLSRFFFVLWFRLYQFFLQLSIKKY